MPVIPGPTDSRAAFAEAIARAVPAYLPAQRWFGDKTRTISAARLADAALVEVGPDVLALALVSVAFAGGDGADYLLPLALTGADLPTAAVLATVEEPAGTRRLADALALSAGRAWFLDRLAAGGRDPGQRGDFAWRPGADLAAHLAAARAGSSRVSGAEQSNSAVVYGGALLLKVFRKLQPGLNPDIEVGRFLTERSSFRNLPPLLGDLTYRPADPALPEISLAMAQPFVPSVGDGWQVMLDRLTATLDADADSTPDDDAVALARRLGQRTAQLHLALAGDPSDPAFAPEPISAADADRWAGDLAAAVDRTIADLHARAESLPSLLRDHLLRLRPDDPELTGRSASFVALVGIAKTRVHGDYHLGQTLVTADGDVVILDFEGEPARPLAERRAKTSPLKDVAGMLRSFAYARAAAQRTASRSLPPASEARPGAWEAAARAAFLDAYLAETRPARAPFLPTDAAAFHAALAAWELDKAVYEVNYELNNRPDWLALPLASLLA